MLYMTPSGRTIIVTVCDAADQVLQPKRSDAVWPAFVLLDN
jgi:hypothetical protein